MAKLQDFLECLVEQGREELADAAMQRFEELTGTSYTAGLELEEAEGGGGAAAVAAGEDGPGGVKEEDGEAE